MILLGLGTNKGNKLANLQEVLSQLNSRGVEVLRQAPIFETEPWGKKNQDSFLNTVIEVKYEGTPQELLQTILQIEQLMGRVREYKWGPRIIDIDILEFNRETIESPGLTIPHPHYPERVFVLAPMAELEPDWVPTNGTMTVTELLATLDSTQASKLVEVN